MEINFNVVKDIFMLPIVLNFSFNIMLIFFIDKISKEYSKTIQLPLDIIALVALTTFVTNFIFLVWTMITKKSKSLFVQFFSFGATVFFSIFVVLNNQSIEKKEHILNNNLYDLKAEIKKMDEFLKTREKKEFIRTYPSKHF